MEENENFLEDQLPNNISWHLLSPYHGKHFTRNISFNPLESPMGLWFAITFYRGRNWNTREQNQRSGSSRSSIRELVSDPTQSTHPLEGNQAVSGDGIRCHLCRWMIWQICPNSAVLGEPSPPSPCSVNMDGTTDVSVGISSLSLKLDVSRSLTQDGFGFWRDME